MSEPDVVLHDVPFPKFLRIGLCVVGVVVAFLVTYELWRGVWPPNFTSPFFAVIMMGGWTVALAAFSAGLWSAPKIYELRRGEFTVIETRFKRSTRTTFAVAQIVTLACRTQESSDGPDMHYVEIVVKSGQVYKSRMFDSAATARTFETQFRRALGM